MATEAHIRDGVEFTSWALLAAATVGSAWCAYQASIWNGEQTRALARASVAQFTSSREMSVVNRALLIDVATFINYISADFRGDRKLAGYLRSHARTEFKPAFETWLADQAAGRTEAPNPFESPDYHIAAQNAVADFDQQALSDIAIANADDATSDGYVLHTVLFALALFFLGGTSEARRRVLRRAMLVTGVLVFSLTVISVARLPRAYHPSLPPPQHHALIKNFN